MPPDLNLVEPVEPWVDLGTHDKTPLDWFGKTDEEHCVILRLHSETALPRSRAAQIPWLREAFEHGWDLGFVLRPCTATAHLRQVHIEPIHLEGRFFPGTRFVRVPLAKVWSLPNDNPAEELAGVQDFLQWLRGKVQAHPGEHAPLLQWFRGGSSSRGLEWVGVAEDQREAWNNELDAWHQRPAFNAWYEATLKNWRTRWYGVHCMAGFKVESEKESRARFEKYSPRARGPKV